MTLILSMAYKDEFVFITSDSRVIKRRYSLAGFERIGEPEKADFSCEKAVKLSDYVLFSTGGNTTLGDLVKEQMQERIKPDADLSECTKVLNDIIEEFRGKKGERSTRGLYDKPSLSLNFLDTPDYFGCCMVGFYKNGGTGMTTFGSGENKVPSEIVSPDEGYPTFMFAPTKDYQEMNRQMFNLPAEAQSLNNFLSVASIVHSSVSYVQSEAVSPDCTFYILYKHPEKQTTEFVTQVIDTSVYYQQFPKDPTELEKKLNPDKK